VRRIYLLRRTLVAAVALLLVAVVVAVWPRHHDDPTTATTPPTTRRALAGYPGMPPVVDASNIYSEIGPGRVPAAHRSDPARVYVPNGGSDTVSEIDVRTRTVVRTFRTLRQPQHIVPSYDLATLWLLDNLGNALVPIDPATGDPGQTVAVDDPYNLYFTPDGASAIVVAEARRRLDFRDPHTMELQSSLAVPTCAGMNHADYNADGAYALFTCEYGGKLVKVDIAHRKVLGTLDLAHAAVPGTPEVMAMRMPDGELTTSMPQDVRAAPDGRHFFVADMMRGGVFVVDGDTFTAQRFIATGVGAHGLTPSRDGKVVYVANRGSDRISGGPHGPGSVSVLDVASERVVATWAVPGGGSPDMGNLNAAGTELWLSGRFDGEVYVFDTVHGGLAARIKVGKGPHGLTVWPQAGRYSLGHTGNMR
jgi:YVTN family beta-propeller protein